MVIIMLGFYKWCFKTLICLGVVLIYVWGGDAKVAGYVSIFCGVLFGLAYVMLKIVFSKQKIELYINPKGKKKHVEDHSN